MKLSVQQLDSSGGLTPATDLLRWADKTNIIQQIEYMERRKTLLFNIGRCLVLMQALMVPMAFILGARSNYGPIAVPVVLMYSSLLGMIGVICMALSPKFRYKIHIIAFSFAVVFIALFLIPA